MASLLLTKSSRFSFSNTLLEKAMSIPALDFQSPSKHTYAAGTRYLALYAASRSGLVRSREILVAKLVELLENAFLPGTEPELRGTMLVWADAHFAAIAAVAKQLPEVWDELSLDAKSRIDWIMKIGTYVGNIQHNSANICNHDIEFLHDGNYNPNQRNGMVSWMSHAYLYFGGESQVNAILAAFDYDEMISVMDAFGWQAMKSRFIGVNTIAAFAGNVTIEVTNKYGVTNASTIGPSGVKEPFTFKGKYIYNPADPAGFGYKRHTNAVAYTPYNLFAAEELGFCVGMRTVDDTGIIGKDCDTVSKIKTGYSSPYLGEDIMPTEYSIGNSRSSSDYVQWGMQSACWHLISMIVFNLFPSKAERNSAVQKMTKAYEIWRYREKNTLWYDSALCEAKGAFNTYSGCDYLEDAFRCCVHPTFENCFVGQR